MDVLVECGLSAVKTHHVNGRVERPDAVGGTIGSYTGQFLKSALAGRAEKHKVAGSFR